MFSFFLSFVLSFSLSFFLPFFLLLSCHVMSCYDSIHADTSTQSHDYGQPNATDMNLDIGIRQGCSRKLGWAFADSQAEFEYTADIPGTMCLAEQSPPTRTDEIAELSSTQFVHTQVQTGPEL